MTHEEANQMLEQAFEAAFAEDPKTAERVVNKYKRLKLSSYHMEGKTTGNLRAVAMERLHALPVMSAEQKGEVITMMVGSGFGGRNPAVLEVVIQGANVTLNAWAKEGLIHQNSAKKAVTAAAEALKLD